MWTISLAGHRLHRLVDHYIGSVYTTRGILGTLEVERGLISQSAVALSLNCRFQELGELGESRPGVGGGGETLFPSACV